MVGRSDDENVLDDVFASGRDRGADSAAPEQKAEPVEAPKAEEPEAPKAEEADSSPKRYRDPETGKFVPLHELRTERQKRQELEARTAELQKQLEAREAWYQDLISKTIQQPKQAPQQVAPQPAPDPMLDPEGFARWQGDQFFRAQLNDRLNLSEEMARDKFGDQVVDSALQAAQKAGVADKFLHTKHPYKELVNWHKQQTALARIGNDPDAYEKSLREKMRAELLEELKAGRVTATGQPAQQPRYAGTLADATASGAQGAHLSDEAMLGSIFDSGRRRK